MADDPYDLNRFIDAQAPVYETVVAELKSGRKRTHWMWFIFPQLAGLGRSPMAQRYAMASVAEAAAYLDHPVLGARLRECTRLVVEIENRTLHEIFGSPADLNPSTYFANRRSPCQCQITHPPIIMTSRTTGVTSAVEDVDTGVSAS